MKAVKCKSGLSGYQCRLQANYNSFDEFVAYAEVYQLHRRLGYRSMSGCWRANPMIQFSVEPSDFRRAPISKP